MNIRFSTAALALLLMSAPVLAQTTNPWPRFIPVRPDGSVIDPGSVGGGGTSGPYYTGQYNSTLPTFVNGQAGYLAVDINGRQILAPSSSINVSNFPATQAVSGTVGLSTGSSVLADLRVAGAAVAAGNPVPVSVSNFPATQAVSNAGTFAVQNTAATPAGANIIGRVGIDQTTPGTTNAVAGLFKYNATPPTLADGDYSPPLMDGNARLDMTMRQTLATPGGNPGVGNSWQFLPNGQGTAIAPSSVAYNAIVPAAPTSSGFTYKASAANLFGFSLTQGATAGFFVLLNVASVPTSGAAIAPNECIPVPANGYVARRQDIADRYTTGFTIVSSSSCTTYTPVAPVLMSAVVQ